MVAAEVLLNQCARAGVGLYSTFRNEGDVATTRNQFFSAKGSKRSVAIRWPGAQVRRKEIDQAQARRRSRFRSAVNYIERISSVLALARPNERALFDKVRQIAGCGGR